MENEHEPAQTPPVGREAARPRSGPVEEVAGEPGGSPGDGESVPEPAPSPPPETAPFRPRETGPRFYAALAALLFFISYSIAFIVGNDRKIHVDFVFAETDVSLIWTILLLLVVGLVGGLLLSQLHRHHRRKQPGKP
jgi:uncharacterized integral membrane protein